MVAVNLLRRGLSAPSANPRRLGTSVAAVMQVGYLHVRGSPTAFSSQHDGQERISEVEL